MSWEGKKARQEGEARSREQGKAMNGQAQPGMGRNWDAERKLEQGRLFRAEVGEMLVGAVRLASVQDQPLKQNYACNRH